MVGVLAHHNGDKLHKLMPIGETVSTFGTFSTVGQTIKLKEEKIERVTKNVFDPSQPSQCLAIVNLCRAAHRGLATPHNSQNGLSNC